MLNNAQRSKLYRWIPLLTLAIIPLGGIAYADATPPAAADAPASQQKKTSKNTPQAIGLKVAVVAASDSSDNQETALRALQAANIGLQRQPGYQIANPQAVAEALQKAGLQWPFAPKQYPQARKALDKADRVLSVSVSPQTGANATYKAIVELVDTKTGGLVGRGEALYTVSSPAPDTQDGDPQMRAVDGAVLGAIADMCKPATLNGVVISRPRGYAARISLGSLGGLRNGARIEYLADGTPIAYGTVIDLGTGESIATIAPESAYGKVQVNTPFRTADIPPAGLMGPSRSEISQKEFDSFAKEFSIASALASIAYLIVK